VGYARPLETARKVLGAFAEPGILLLVFLAARRVVEEKDASLAEKEQALRDLTDRLARSESDRKALERATKEGSALSAELAAAKKALEEIRLRVDEKTPQVAGGRYDQAVQPTDPSVRDFAVKATSAAPGAWDNPQGTRLPNAAGSRQLVLVHAAIASNWKYVSDPSVSLQDYTSPARTMISLRSRTVISKNSRDVSKKAAT
jgi:hypothetical protein